MCRIVASAPSTALTKTIRAAQYVRMSTEHQRYSAENQKQRIAAYAKLHEIEIVRTYADLGKSGLTLEGREGLGNLLSDVVAGRADYNVVLVYDVSRWGRFQDTDEAAHYEFVCRRAGIQVHYCAELFNNDGSFPSTLMKTMKRTMAGEYSRELSAKVFAGQCRLVQLGFRQGGKPGYGIRRLLLDDTGKPKQLLQPGQYKNLHSDRVVLVPGTKREITIVREIYARYTQRRQTPYQISKELNGRGVQGHLGNPWTASTIREILMNPKYAGVNAYGRTTQKLKTRSRPTPASQWIIREKAFAPIVSREQFNKAAEIIASRKKRRVTREHLLQAARRIMEREGKLSYELIEKAKDAPCINSFLKHFAGLDELHVQLGYSLPSSLKYVKQRRIMRAMKRKLLGQIVEQLCAVGASVEYRRGQQLLINNSFTAALRLAVFHKTKAGNIGWEMGLQRTVTPDITIFARLRPDNTDVMDYYIVPSTQGLPIPATLRLQVHNGPLWDTYRFENLDFFLRLASRMPLLESLCPSKERELPKHALAARTWVPLLPPNPQTA